MERLIQTHLTFNYQDNFRPNFQADNSVHAIELVRQGLSLSDFLQTKHHTQEARFNILALENIFQRNVNGFGPINPFIELLSHLLNTNSIEYSPICHLNAFSYAFLAHAKHFDLLMCVDNLSEVDKKIAGLEREIQAVCEYERIGEAFKEEDNWLKTPYLKLRKIISKTTAKNGRGVLSLLLFSGTIDDETMTSYLRGNRLLTQQLLPALQETGIVYYKSPYFGLDERYLSIVLFCLQETQGFDLICMLKALYKDN